MPFMHVEDAAVTQQALDSFIGLLAELRQEFGAESQPYKAVTKNWASCVPNHDIIKKFGRYPSRNAILDRTDTEAEKNKDVVPIKES